jgi:L-fuculose-phosphate aldolase
LIDKKISELLSNISLALFRKNFFGIYHGSISSKIDHNTFIINTKEAIFDEIDLAHLCQLNMNTCDYSWKLASIESHIHNSIYTDIHEAKYIACGMPPYTTAYALKHNIIKLEDYFGKTLFGEITVYDAGDFDTWYERNSSEITKYLKQSKNHIMVIRGVGVYVYDRDINELIKKVAILENSCRLLALQ